MSAGEEPNPPTPFPEKEGGENSSPSPLAGEGSERSERVRGETSTTGKAHPSPGGEAPPPSPARGEGKTEPAPRRSSSRLRRIALVVAIAAIAFGIWYFAIRTPEPRDDFGRFQGEWQVAVPADTSEKQQAARLVQGITIRVTGDRWVYRLGDKEQKKYTMVLRPETNPKEIDLTQLAPDDKPLMQKWPPPARPVMIRGIYTVERDRAKIVSAPGGEPRPTDLDATDGVTVLLLERIK